MRSAERCGSPALGLELRLARGAMATGCALASVEELTLDYDGSDFERRDLARVLITSCPLVLTMTPFTVDHYAAMELNLGEDVLLELVSLLCGNQRCRAS